MSIPPLQQQQGFLMQQQQQQQKFVPQQKSAPQQSIQNLQSQTQVTPTTTMNVEVNLDKVLKKDGTEIQTLRGCLRDRGWCFVKAPPQLLQQSKQCLKVTSQFLQLSDDQKKKFSFDPYFGYFQNDNKQGFRLLTGPYLNRMPLFDNSISTLSQMLDGLCQQLLVASGKTIFNSEEVLAQMIPLVAKKQKQVTHEFHRTLGKLLPDAMARYTLMANTIRREFVEYGMLDMVMYNQNSTTDFNVKEHHDPGLFSISLGSTAPGLQMFDNTTSSWVTVPVDKCVLWTGAMANAITNGDIRVGTHRVITAGPPRYTLWYEVCVDSQVPAGIRNDGIFTQEIVSMEVSKVPQRNLTVWIFGRQKTVTVNPNGNLSQILRIIEREDGIPPTKRMPSFHVNNKSIPQTTLVKDIPPDVQIHYS
jgi:isopenicillin N synthase-like dioxygenase